MSGQAPPPVATELDLRDLDRVPGATDGADFVRALFRDLPDAVWTGLSEQPDGVAYGRVRIPVRLSAGLKRQIAELDGELSERRGCLEWVRFQWTFVTCDPPEGATLASKRGWFARLFGIRR